MFNDQQIKTLSQELDSSRIKTRSKGNINLSYLEGFDIIDTTNKIFGYGNWSYNVSSLEQVSQEKNQNDNFVICYKAVVKLVIHNEDHTKSITREDVGFGTGVAKTLADANEGAAKESLTDGLKRCCRSLGTQFGNSLYDKSRNHNSTTQNPPQNLQTPRVEQQQYSQVSNHQQHSFNQFEYDSLYRLGLDIVDNGNGYLIVTGDDIFSKKDSVKACGFRWDGNSKLWYKPIEQGAA